MASVKKVITDFIQDTYRIKLDILGEYASFGIRGAVPDGHGDLMNTKNEFNKYDDSIGWITANERYIVKGTVEPGKKYTVAPMNPNGAFYLKNGLYVMTRAKHFGNDAFNLNRKYPKGLLEGYRDTKRLGKNPFYIDPNAKIWTDGTGIDVHAMGNNINDIAGQSAGCQGTLGDWNSDAWKGYKNPLYASKQKEFLYCLFDYSEIKENYEK